jgi:hypothetical protein
MLALTGYSDSFLKDYSSLRAQNLFATLSANSRHERIVTQPPAADHFTLLARPRS